MAMAPCWPRRLIALTQCCGPTLLRGVGRSPPSPPTPTTTPPFSAVVNVTLRPSTSCWPSRSCSLIRRRFHSSSVGLPGFLNPGDHRQPHTRRIARPSTKLCSSTCSAPWPMDDELYKLVDQHWTVPPRTGTAISCHQGHRPVQSLDDLAVAPPASGGDAHGCATTSRLENSCRLPTASRRGGRSSWYRPGRRRKPLPGNAAVMTLLGVVGSLTASTDANSNLHFGE